MLIIHGITFEFTYFSEFEFIFEKKIIWGKNGETGGCF
jgi:hypothetical protein